MRAKPFVKDDNHTFAEMLERYKKEVSVKKRGARWEIIRINKIMREEEGYLLDKKITSITKNDIANWRDRKIKSGLKNSSINREWIILSNIFHFAIYEWEWLKEHPMKGVSRPSALPPRERLITDEEVEKMLEALKYTDDGILDTQTKRVGAIFIFALETAMRAQEICYLKWDEISGRVAKVNTSKTRSGIREVPLSKRAMQLLEQVKQSDVDSETVFGVNKQNLDALFRKARQKAGLSGFTFHDARATAITRLAKKLDILDLAKMIGHKDLKMLMVYYRETAEQLADKLD